MSTIKVDTIATRTGSGNITASNTIAGTSATLSGTLAVTGATTTAGITSTGRHDVNFNGSGTQAFKYTDTGGGNLASFGQFYNPSNALIGNIQNANNDGIHLNIKNGSVVFSNTGYTAANALDDYEEGSWTPVWSQGVGSPGYLVQQGRYTKIGNRVTLSCYLRSNSGSANGSHVYIGGLPFTATNSITAADGGYNTYLGGFYTATNGAQWLVINNSTIVALYRQTDGAALGGTSTGVSVHSDVRIVISYQTD